jgi:uncharacterized membrane protein YqjE
MSVIAHETASRRTDVPERGALLLWMTFTGLSVFAAVVLWQYGLIRLMVTSDRTYISSVIAVLYIATCFHCFWRTRASRAKATRLSAAARSCRHRTARKRSMPAPTRCRPGW